MHIINFLFANKVWSFATLFKLEYHRNQRLSCVRNTGLNPETFGIKGGEGVHIHCTGLLDIYNLIPMFLLAPLVLLQLIALVPYVCSCNQPCGQVFLKDRIYNGSSALKK